MPSGKALVGIILIVFSAALVCLPFTDAMSAKTLTGGRLDESNINPLLGYQLYPEFNFPKKIEVSLSNLTDGVKVRLVAYTKSAVEISPGDGYALGKEATERNGKATLSFTELGFEATRLGFEATGYYVEAVSGNQEDLMGAEIDVVTTPLITVLIGPILALVGIVLLLWDRAGAGVRRRRRVPYNEEAPEPTFQARSVKRAAKKKRKKTKVPRPKAAEVSEPKMKTLKCPQCGANVPVGQMYCPSCYAKV